MRPASPFGGKEDVLGKALPGVRPSQLASNSARLALKARLSPLWLVRRAIRPNLVLLQALSGGLRIVALDKAKITTLAAVAVNSDARRWPWPRQLGLESVSGGLLPRSVVGFGGMRGGWAGATRIRYPKFLRVGLGVIAPGPRPGYARGISWATTVSAWRAADRHVSNCPKGIRCGWVRRARHRRTAKGRGRRRRVPVRGGRFR